MKSLAFCLSSSAVRILLYSSLSSKSSKVSIPAAICCGLFCCENKLGLENCLKVLTIWTDLCSMIARKINRLFSVIALFPPSCLTSSRSHSMVSKILSMLMLNGLISVWFFWYYFFVSSRLCFRVLRLDSSSLTNWSLVWCSLSPSCADFNSLVI